MIHPFCPASVPGEMKYIELRLRFAQARTMLHVDSTWFQKSLLVYVYLLMVNRKKLPSIVTLSFANLLQQELHYTLLVAGRKRKDLLSTCGGRGSWSLLVKGPSCFGLVNSVYPRVQSSRISNPLVNIFLICYHFSFFCFQCPLSSFLFLFGLC